MSASWTSRWLRRTNTGRVVYEREKHEFTPADIDRITKKVIDGKDYTFVEQLLHDMSTFLLRRILILVGAEGFTESVYQFLLFIVDWAVDFIGNAGVDLYRRFLSIFVRRIAEFNEEHPSQMLV